MPSLPPRFPRSKFFAIIVSESAEGEDDDYADNRHWFVTAHCSNVFEPTGEDFAEKWASILEEQKEAATFAKWVKDEDPLFFVGTATNTASTMHVVPTDGTQVVEVFPIAGVDSPDVSRFLFTW